MLRGRAWLRLLPDVYIHRGAFRPDDHHTWCEAVALTLPPGAAIAGPSAAYLWGVPLLTPDAPVTVALPRAARMRRHPRITVTRSALPSTDLTRRAGLPVTTPLRTAFDLGRRLPRTEAVVAVDALLHRGVVELSALHEYAAHRAGWPGLPLLRVVLSLVEPRAGSPMASRLRLLLLDSGLPTPVAGYDVYDAQGRPVTRFDLAYPSHRLGVEVTAGTSDSPAALPSPPARSPALRPAGWQVIRCTADDILRHPNRTARMVAAALRRRPATGVPAARCPTPGSDTTAHRVPRGLPHR